MDPLAQERFIGAEREEIVHGLAYHRRGTTDGTAWVLQVGRIVGGTTHLTHIAVLVSRAARGIRASATDEAIWQKTPILLAVILRHWARHDMTLLAQALEDIFRVLTVFRTVGRIKTVKRNMEISKVTLMLNVIMADEIFGCHAGTL